MHTPVPFHADKALDLTRDLFENVVRWEHAMQLADVLEHVSSTMGGGGEQPPPPPSSWG